MVDVSIIIINYNANELLAKCLETLHDFTKKVTFEVIVVDNGSENKNDLNQIIAKYPETKLIINLKSKGFAAVNNQGIAHASGKYILMLNNDVVLIEDAISKVVGFSKNVNDEAIIGCELLNEDKSYQISIVDFDNVLNMFGESFFLYKIFKRSKLLNKYHHNYSDHDQIKDVEALKGAFLFIPKNILTKLNGLDERFYFYYEETDFCYRWKKLGGKVFYFSDASIIHVGGASTDSNLWFKFKNQHISRLRFFKKHFSGLKLYTMILLHELGLLIRVPIYILMGIVMLKKSLLKKSFYYLRSMFIYSQESVSENS